MVKKSILKQKRPAARIPLYPRRYPPYRVHWNWEITYSCNYRCSYCIFWKEKRKEKYIVVNIRKWERIWDSIFEKYWSCHIRFSGGEPTIYPDFFQLVKILLKKHTVDITTNLSFDIDSFMRMIKPEGISISSSFHPEFDEILSFLKKASFLQRSGYPITISCVAYPPYLSLLKEFNSVSIEKGIAFKVIPFIGKWNGITYPQGYTDEERDLLSKIAKRSLFSDSNVRRITWSSKSRSLRDRFCRMGQMYAKIFPDGRVTRCCAKDSGELGNILDRNFRLLDKAEPCEVKGHCPCFKAMLVGKESSWGHLWV